MYPLWCHFSPPFFQRITTSFFIFLFIYNGFIFFGPKHGKIISLSKQATNFLGDNTFCSVVIITITSISLYITWQLLQYYVYIIISDNVRRQSVFGSSQFQCGRYILSTDERARTISIVKQKGADERKRMWFALLLYVFVSLHISLFFSDPISLFIVFNLI